VPHAFVQRPLVPAAFILLWSSAYIVVRMGLPDMSPIAQLALRFVIATATAGFVLSSVGVWLAQRETPRILRVLTVSVMVSP